MTVIVNNNAYKECPISSNTLKKAGQVAFVAINVGAAVAPLIGAMFDPKTALEATLDAFVHGARVAVHVYNGPTWCADILDGLRLATLVRGRSVFPATIIAGDTIIHAGNLLLGRVLKK